MLSPDLQRIKHIRDYCVEVEWGRLLVTETPLTSLIMTPTISACFVLHSADWWTQRWAVSGVPPVNRQICSVGTHQRNAESGCPQLRKHEQGHHLGNRQRWYSGFKKLLRGAAFHCRTVTAFWPQKSLETYIIGIIPLNTDSNAVYDPPYIVETKYSPLYWDGIHGNHTLLWYSGSLYPYRRLRQLAFKKWCKNAPESIALQWIPGLYLFDSPWDAKNT